MYEHYRLKNTFGYVPIKQISFRINDNVTTKLNNKEGQDTRLTIERSGSLDFGHVNPLQYI